MGQKKCSTRTVGACGNLNRGSTSGRGPIERLGGAERVKTMTTDNETNAYCGVCGALLFVRWNGHYDAAIHSGVVACWWR